MVIEQWNELTIKEKIQLVGKINHLLMNDADAFMTLTSMVRSAEQAGAFNDITINPEPIKNAGGD